MFVSILIYLLYLKIVFPYYCCDLVYFVKTVYIEKERGMWGKASNRETENGKMLARRGGFGIFRKSSVD